MCDEIHTHDSLAGVELAHGGVHSQRFESRLPAVAPSQIAGDFVLVVPNVPKPLEKSDIRRIQEDWVEAAKRARRAGFDIVYVYGADSYLPVQFLSSFYNKRTDEYGGSLENRARFWRETLEVVKEAVGDDCTIAVRIAVDALGPAGVHLEEALEFILLVDQFVDLWDVTVGSLGEWSKNSGSSKFFSEGFQLEWTSKVRSATVKPIVGVGRLTDPNRMAEILHSGVWDIIGAARPSIADPFLPRKIEEGRLDDIRECVGNNQCTARVAIGRHIGCSQNATAGEEYRRGWHPERFTQAANADNDVLVVGAGPAGLECALVLARRGFRRIHLVDEGEELGGALKWVSRLPGLGEWARIVNHRKIQLEKLTNVTIISGHVLDASAIREYGADIVVLATGSHWAGNGLNGFSQGPIDGADSTLAHVLTPEQIMVEGKECPGEDVVVYDCDGYFLGATLAEKLANEGLRVELITPLTQVAPFCDYTLEGSLLRDRLHELGVVLTRTTSINAIYDDHVTRRGEFGDVSESPSAAVVLVTQRVSNDTAYLDLAAESQTAGEAAAMSLYRIGDCVAPRFLPDVIFDGHRLGREIDTTTPAQPAPFRREGFLMERPPTLVEA
jgi:dimethylamine/trimethylamine dehydrogenase